MRYPRLKVMKVKPTTAPGKVTYNTPYTKHHKNKCKTVTKMALAQSKITLRSTSEDYTQQSKRSGQWKDQGQRSSVTQNIPTETTPHKHDSRIECKTWVNLL